jgi:hypothetical protein
MAIAADNPKVQQALEKLDKALAQEVASLTKMNKQQEAQEVLALQKAVEERVMPLNDPGKCRELRMRTFFDQLPFPWNRPTNPDRFVFETVPTPQGPSIVTKVVTPTGAVPTTGRLRITGDDSAEVKWTNGITWKVYAAGPKRLLVDEYNGEVRQNDGIMLYR